MLTFIFTFTIAFFIGRGIQGIRKRKLEKELCALKHQEMILKTGNPFWQILPENKVNRVNVDRVNVTRTNVDRH